MWEKYIFHSNAFSRPFCQNARLVYARQECHMEGTAI
jgi:hypothetical protein